MPRRAENRWCSGCGDPASSGCAAARHALEQPKIHAVSSSPTPVLDEEALQRLRDLDPDGRNRLLERVLGAFESSAAKLGAQLADARQRGDMQVVRHVAHTIKSSSASIGALRLSRLCAEIEAAVRLEAVSGLAPLLDDVDRELVLVLQALQPMRGKG
ncbi:MAG: Hpt domain-containing protein [Caldimonas sp.]